MFKNITLIKTSLHGKKSWRLLDSDGAPIRAFDIFAKTLERNSVNTRSNYCRWLAEFFDYLFEASVETPTGRDGNVSHNDLADVIAAYDEYLVFGADSGKEIARRVNNTLPSPRNSKRSSATKHAAIKSFLKLSERVREQILEMTNKGVVIPFLVEERGLFVGIGKKSKIPLFQRNAMVNNSMLAGVIAGGPKWIEEGILPTSAPDISYDQEQAFPFNRVGDVLANLTTHRDRALYAFCASSGCRISEALQLLWQDIDTTARTVKLVDPNCRLNSPSYLALSPKERDQLVWKGRATQLTLLIDPFATMFFEALALYLRHEYIPHGRHEFVFQYICNKENQGEPYFLAAASSRNGVLKRAIRLSGIERINGPHSLRHMYGTYLLNYFPRPDGTYGLPLGLVQKLMGHCQAKDTAKYARYDRDILDAELAYANLMVFGNGKTRSVNELKRQALLHRLSEVEARLLEETGE
ncbi:tyrosine-type recombinase/integrase [Chitinibacter tainanensis]|uniref:tyrosine-type recombinase/integrase n=1 Tax=Chitinibacter tainanensis TaxID=230667 RepID=UPI0004120DB8|nr:tyrosine-type recombinase/integrase [Chitinibacter tainanensis]